MPTNVQTAIAVGLAAEKLQKALQTMKEARTEWEELSATTATLRKEMEEYDSKKRDRLEDLISLGKRAGLFKYYTERTKEAKEKLTDAQTAAIEAEEELAKAKLE